MSLNVSAEVAKPKPTAAPKYPRLMTHRNIKEAYGKPSVVLQIFEDSAVCLNHWAEPVGYVFDFVPSQWVPFYGSVTITSEP